MDIDKILQNAMQCTEKPSPALLYKLKNKERFEMQKRFRKPLVAVLAAMIAIFSLSAIAVAAQRVWRNLDVEIIEGEEFVNYVGVKTAEAGDLEVWQIEVDNERMSESPDGAVILEVEGNRVVIMDNLHFDDLDEALALLEIDAPLLPTYLPEGFAFNRATFPINPLVHDDKLASTRMFIDYMRGDETIRLQISAHAWEIGVFSATQEDIAINGNPAAIANEMIAVLSDNVLYFIDGDLSRDELIRIAESLQ